MNKQEFLNIIKKAVTATFRNCNVYSTNVVNDVILGLDNTNIEENIFIYGDFNGLGRINKEYGHQEGSRCLENAINRISQLLPKDSVIYRIGGDEFLFTYKDTEEQVNIEEKIIKINNELLEIEENKNLTIELAGCDIKEENGLTISEKLEQLKKDVEKLKIKRIDKNEKKDTEDKWQELKVEINEKMKKYIETFRLEEGYKIDGENAEKRMDLMSKVLKLSLRENKSKIYKGSQKEKIEKLAEVKNIKKDRDKNQINQLYNWLIKNKTEDIEKFDETFLKDIARAWFKNHISGLYNKKFLEEDLKYYEKEDIAKYEFIFFSGVGIKVYNDTIGHDETDSMMKQCSKTICKYIKTDIEKLKENELENSVYRSNLIDIGAGDYILLNKKTRNKEKQINEEDISKLENKINADSNISVSIIKKDSEEYLKYSDLDEFIISLRNNINSKKRKLKEDILNSEVAMELFEKIVNGLSNKYKTTIDNYDSEENKKKWTQMISLGILSNICEIKEFEIENSKKNNVNYKRNDDEEIR